MSSDYRYPVPDPDDPFAPLWLLRSRSSHSELASPLPADTLSIDPHASSSSSNPCAYMNPRPAPSTPSRRVDPRHSRHTLSLSSLAHIRTPTFTANLHPEPEWALPTLAQLARAAALPVIAASGLRLPFAALFAARPTVVLFLRHFWCPLCQDYMTCLADASPPEHMFDPRRNRVDLVVISNGAPAFIPKYKQLFGLPFDLYTDPSLAIYDALGMARPFPQDCPVDGLQRPTVLDGGYVRHGPVRRIAMVVMRALKAGMPIWEKGGDIHQLGGEFVLGPGLKCTYAHRMQSPKGHAPIRDVLFAAGVHLPVPAPSPPITTPPALSTFRSLSFAFPTLPRRARHSASLPTPRRRNSTNTHRAPDPMREFGAWRRRSVDSAGGGSAPRASVVATEAGPPQTGFAASHEDEAAWMHERMQSLERLRQRKSERRGAFVGYFRAGSGFGPAAGTRSDSGHCSPVREEEGDADAVMVIGFVDGNGDVMEDGKR
ncbi:hypothetical protein D9615_010600 [Tricholomella constricta]|uniref:Uncharacterized protein n=1 Tax=Tricholomella constricta TaxID=117010 RepID=A0A8H5LRA2_9AGAR|nr:hypothetical protein D9615_010600 [Tricholomella constricta]